MNLINNLGDMRGSNMREISLHIMDIIQNSIEANANSIELTIEENTLKDYLKIIIKDNGKGMDKDILSHVKDPFVTTRSTRRVGLGISLFEAACIRCGGNLNIESQLGIGTTITAVMKYSHIDRAPLGKIVDTIISILLFPNIDLIYKHVHNENEFVFSTKEIKKIAGEDLSSQEVIFWIKDYLIEGIESTGTDINA